MRSLSEKHRLEQNLTELISSCWFEFLFIFITETVDARFLSSMATRLMANRFSMQIEAFDDF